MYKFSVNIKFILLLLSLFFISGSLKAQWDKITNIPSPFHDNYYLEICFLPDDPNYGWICGYQGMVIRTTDAGKTWAGTRIGGADQLESVHFADKKTGYVSGVGTDIYSRGVIFKTNDGGITWRDVTPSKRRDILWGNYFYDRNNGVVIGGGCGDTPQQFFRTTDGGNSWSMFETKQGDNGLTDVILYPDGRGYATSSGKIWYSSDGGYKWQITMADGGLDWQEDLCISNNTILVPWAEGCSGGGYNGGVRTSRNFGVSWTDYNTAVPMFGGFLHDDMRGWACGWGESIYYTSNGGMTWTLRNCGIEPGTSLDDFYFINDTTGFVCGQGVYAFALPKKVIAEIIPVDTVSCDGDTITLTSKDEFRHYEWSTKESTRSIKVTKSGTYSLKVYNSICDTAIPKAITVRMDSKPKLDITANGKTTLCDGDSLVLTAQTDALSFIWSTGDTSQSIIVKKSGKYKVTVASLYKCTSSKEISITVVPLPKPKLTVIGKNSFCAGDSVTISANPLYPKYIWTDGNGKSWETTQNSITVSASGKYSVIAYSAEGCVGLSDTIDIIVRQETNKLTFSYKTVNNEFSLDSTYFPNLVCKELTINNVTDSPTTFEMPYIFHNISFSMPQHQFPMTILPYDSVKLIICFSPSMLGYERDTIVFNDICSNHNLYLVAKTLANIYGGNSLCESEIVATTKKLPKKYLFSTSAPFPNPSSTFVKVPFNKYSIDKVATTEEAVLLDIYGIQKQTADLFIKSENNLNGAFLTIGEFNFNLDNVESGTYFILVKSLSGVDNYIFSVIK